MMITRARVGGNRDASRPMQGERRSVRSPMAQTAAVADPGFSAEYLDAVGRG